MCEAFARLNLTQCPADIAQRLADGLGTTLSVVNYACSPVFNYVQLLSHPTNHLPVLFSSASYRSPLLGSNIAPRIMDLVIDEYWFGAFLGAYDTLMARAGDIVYAWMSDTSPPVSWLWKKLDYNTMGFRVRSVPGACLLLAEFEGQVVFQRGELSDIIGHIPGATTGRISEDCTTCFVRDSTGWLKYIGDQVWVRVGNQDPSFELSPSFDGSSFVQSNTQSLVYYNLGGNTSYKTVVVPVDSNNVYTAIIGTTVFIVRGLQIYTVGSNSIRYTLNLVQPLTSPAKGMWADQHTVWISTAVATYRSSDLGWTWIKQNSVVAVGPGLYTTGSTNWVQGGSTQSFVESVEFPLQLHNSGLLSSPTWTSWFDLAGQTNAYTAITPETEAAISPNGLFLLTQVEGVFTVYLNVWNTDAFKAWCGGNNCTAGYIEYCNQFGAIDSRCAVQDTPSDDSPTPPSKPAGLSAIWIMFLMIIFIAAGVLLYLLMS